MTTVADISPVRQRRIPLSIGGHFPLSFGPGYFGPIPLARFPFPPCLPARALCPCAADSGWISIRDRLPGRARRGDSEAALDEDQQACVLYLAADFPANTCTAATNRCTGSPVGGRRWPRRPCCEHGKAALQILTSDTDACPADIPTART
jgi:hypothetical protein